MLEEGRGRVVLGGPHQDVEDVEQVDLLGAERSVVLLADEVGELLGQAHPEGDQELGAGSARAEDGEVGTPELRAGRVLADKDRILLAGDRERSLETVHELRGG